MQNSQSREIKRPLREKMIW